MFRAMRFQGALHVHDGASPGPGVERALRFSRECGWGAHVGIGSDRLPAGRWTRLCTLRARYRPIVEQVPGGAPVIYHQLEGLDLFATEDEGRHRFLWIHEPFLRWPEVLGWAARYADAFIFDDLAWEAEAVEAVHWIPHRRRMVLPAATLHASNGTISDLSGLLSLPIVRRFASPPGRFNLLGFYRRQIGWLV